MGKDTELVGGAFDRRILELADSMSPEEVSRQLGGVLSPAKIALRTRDLLKARDWLTAAEQDQLITLKMKRILSELEGRYLDNDNAKIQIAVLKALGDRLDKRSAATSLDLETYNDNVGRQLGHVVDLALTYMKGALRDEVDPDRWDELVQDALTLAQNQIEEKQVEA